MTERNSGLGWDSRKVSYRGLKNGRCPRKGTGGGVRRPQSCLTRHQGKTSCTALKGLKPIGTLMFPKGTYRPLPPLREKGIISPLSSPSELANSFGEYRAT